MAGGLVFVTSRDNVLWAVDAATGRQLWRVDHQMSWNTSPPVDEGAVDAGSSDAHFLRALDAGTGRQLWRLDTDGAVWSSPAIAGGLVYVGDGSGTLYAADRRTGQERWWYRAGR